MDLVHEKTFPFSSRTPHAYKIPLEVLHITLSSSKCLALNNQINWILCLKMYLKTSLIIQKPKKNYI